MGIDEAALAASLGITQSAEHDPFVYARGRLCIEATAAGVQPIAVADPMGVQTGHLSHEEMAKIATDTRNLGFKGMSVGTPAWIAPVNEAYTPTNRWSNTTPRSERFSPRPLPPAPPRLPSPGA